MKSTRMMRVFTWIVSLALVLAMIPLQPDVSFAQAPPPTSDGLSPRCNQEVPLADAGRDFVIDVGLAAKFNGYAASPSNQIAQYEWDFDGDGVIDERSSTTGAATHVYAAAGDYVAQFKVSDLEGNVRRDRVQVSVRPGAGEQAYLPEIALRTIAPLAPAKPANGVANRFALMINGGSEARFWDDVLFMYPILLNDYKIPAERIFLFNNDGTNPQQQNPGGMIDGATTVANITTAFNTLQSILDADDELFVWVTDHGTGYLGEKMDAYGYLAARATVQPGDEQDFLERDFKLRSFMTHFDGHLVQHGMNVFKARRFYISYLDAYLMYRLNYVSTFSNMQFEQLGVRSDSDIYIEQIVDYLLGDTNRDGIIDTRAGERFDYDQDGIQPYDYDSNRFDEDDWGGVDTFDDNFSFINSGVPGQNASYKIFDQGFDNRVDIDLNYVEGQPLHVDGTDLDNQGLFDGMDINDDGDRNDWISIDEGIYLAGDTLWDDEMDALLDRVAPKVTSIFMQQCNSGGFIDDLSAPNRVIVTATEEDTYSWGNLFVELFSEALHRATRYGQPIDADADRNGCISMAEAFNYAAPRDYYDEIPQYDDNGDGLGHRTPIPSGGDGALGARTYLATCSAPQARITFIKDSQPDSMQDFTFYTPFGKYLLDDAMPDDGDSVQKSVTFNVAALATYNFSEATLPSWYLAAINCTPAEKATVDLVNRKLTLSVVANDSVTCTWVNQRRVNLQATKFNDLNGDGSYAFSEPTLAGWEMVLYNSQNQRLLGKVTESSGSTVFNNRTPGTYKLCETPKAGWSNTIPGQLEPTLNKPCYQLTLLPGQNASLLFGNAYGVVRTAEEIDPTIGVTISELADINEPEGEESDEGELNQQIFLPMIGR